MGSSLSNPRKVLLGRTQALRNLQASPRSEISRGIFLLKPMRLSKCVQAMRDCATVRVASLSRSTARSREEWDLPPARQRATPTQRRSGKARKWHCAAAVRRCQSTRGPLGRFEYPFPPMHSGQSSSVRWHFDPQREHTMPWLATVPVALGGIATLVADGADMPSRTDQPDFETHRDQ